MDPPVYHFFEDVWFEPWDSPKGGAVVSRFERVPVTEAEILEIPDGWKNPFLAGWCQHLLTDNARMIQENADLKVALSKTTAPTIRTAQGEAIHIGFIDRRPE